MAPTGWETGEREPEIARQLGNWAKADGSGVATSSAAGYRLPDGAVRAPDAAWVLRSRLARVSAEQRLRFLPLCPDFVLELRSPTDRLQDLQAKLQEYLANGARLGWLLDPEARHVYVYRPDAPIERLDQPDTVAGDPVLPGFVLDLRGNPGGVFDQAVGVSALFLNRGVIVTLVGAHSGRHVYTAGRGATTLPLVVLVDRETASAAEIVAAALQDNRRAVIVGENTYGKALVQSIRPLGNGAALRLTTAHYYTPKGTDISLHGVTPDLHAVDNPSTRTDEALQAALQLFLH